MVLLVVSALVIGIGAYSYRDYLRGPRADARAAVKALKNGDLVAVHERLSANRGRSDFAYFFASEVTPRDLGDALATVAGESKDEPFKVGIDTAAYDLTLTDLAGALALATHGTGDKVLPESWARDFLLATTTPTHLYGAHDGFFDWDGKKREKQDKANRANLLLLLSRGYWSQEFLQPITRGYYDFDRAQGEDAWPEADPDDDVGYAPAPNGAYLTDGVLALTAALTSNSSASEWAFTDFQPGTVKVEGTSHTLSAFTHFLLFEHRYPEGANDESIGVTATLTALSSAITSANAKAAAGITDPPAGTSRDAKLELDAEVIHTLARDLVTGERCSKNPLTYGHCAKRFAQAVWRVVQTWGHQALKILTMTTFVPMPFGAVGVAAATTNATWYAIEGDYEKAGLSLVAAVPGLAVARGKTITEGAVIAGKKAGQEAGKVVLKEVGEKWSAQMTEAVTAWRPLPPWRDCDLVPQGGLRLAYEGEWSSNQRSLANAEVKVIWEVAARRELTSASPRLSDVTTPDAAVNASLGQQIADQVVELAPSDPIPFAAIC